ncbi:dihydroxyacetone kinase family protein [Aureimonas sp. AU4]|uniref:dihydroxyacetone kinase family protein n=1 Tax=Aureimonas sp. AU4 TaxID=1638163 RepID=UPI00078545B8|nr:dihydroxyacetone kinase subunit L [Aureimonas sp. AU4]
MHTIGSTDLVPLFESWSTLFTEKRDELIALDGKVGDSDLGITMSKGFAAALEAVRAEGSEASLAKRFKTAGAAMARAAPSTMGTLTATGFMRAGKALDGVTELGVPEIAIFWSAFRDGIGERGKAKPGDKTILDVLYPLTAEMEAQAAAGTDLASALATGARTAEDALEATKTMTAQHGKAAAFREKTVGLQDAGATVAALMARGLFDFAVAH